MNEHHRDEDKHLFFFEIHRLLAPQERIKVRDLKELIAKHVQEFDRQHTLVLEEHGDRPDKPLKDDEEIRILDFPHFYAQPPANFGS